mmetsp:Transcript_92639/g.207421  ORF Transcript_92639/g.207421 Transcript_92639/m.207421 type:complete len:210 (+) Transcript_92639:298-927(+)
MVLQVLVLVVVALHVRPSRQKCVSEAAETTLLLLLATPISTPARGRFLSQDRLPAPHTSGLHLTAGEHVGHKKHAQERVAANDGRVRDPHPRLTGVAVHHVQANHYGGGQDDAHHAHPEAQLHQWVVEVVVLQLPRQVLLGPPSDGGQLDPVNLLVEVHGAHVTPDRVPKLGLAPLDAIREAPRAAQSSPHWQLWASAAEARALHVILH